ncbi:PWI domain-containing protein, partial [Ascobolus immersus RN42]
SQKVDMKKVKLEAIKPWIAKTLTDLMGGNEDDVLIDYTFTLLEEKANVGFPNPDPRYIQHNLTGFLGAKDTPPFCHKLWKLLLSAQSNPTGIPEELIEAKKEELRKEKV